MSRERTLSRKPLTTGMALPLKPTARCRARYGALLGCKEILQPEDDERWAAADRGDVHQRAGARVLLSMPMPLSTCPCVREAYDIHTVVLVETQLPDIHTN